MTTTRHELELLAPARTADIGIEAVNHGADAVYIGGPAFGARTSASNEVADIERLVKHAHRFGARIFVTLNTILRDDELEPARRLIQQVYEAGADALIVQDMGLLELDLPPIQLHASTQCDIRSVEKARFLQDVGFSQIVLARELTLEQIRDVARATSCVIEFFVHGALCVAYSGQCFISHAHTGRSANRGDCSQACRLPYNVLDDQGRIVAHEQHVLSMKDNNQSANLRALVDAGVSSFKIEGRYKDLAYVKNITGHYRRLLDEVLEARPSHRRASSGRTQLFFTPDPDKNFNRGSTDYFVNGRQADIGAFDSPKFAGHEIGHVLRVGPNWFDLQTAVTLHNGDGLTYYTLHKELIGVPVNRVERQGEAWRVYPRDPIPTLPDLRAGTSVNRNRDQSWEQALTRRTAERRIAVWMHLQERLGASGDSEPSGLHLTLTDEDGHCVRVEQLCELQPARQTQQALDGLREYLGKLGASLFEAQDIRVDLSQPWFVPAAIVNQLRRDAVAALEAERLRSYRRPPQARPVVPPVPFPEDSLSYLANVLNHKARDFYARHGVRVIEAAYEAHEELGEVSLMITKHCVRYSLSLCPKQAKGVTGVQGTLRADPMVLVNGKEKLTLRFDCKPCEMHVVGRIKKAVLRQQPAPVGEAPVRFYRSRPSAQAPRRADPAA